MYGKTGLASPEDLQLLFDQKVSFFHRDSKQSVQLCQEHYTKMYSHLRQTFACESCGAKSKRGEIHTRHCPSPKVINKYLLHVSTEAIAVSQQRAKYVSHAISILQQC